MIEDFEESCMDPERSEDVQDTVSGRVISNVLFTIAALGIVITCIVFEIPYNVLKDYLKTYIN